MSIYKPTNCYPFADAVDITQSFMRLEKKDGEWAFGKPPGAYLTCKLETSNSRVIGYRVKMYERGNLIFEGSRVSPVSELPRFNEDPTINTGLNGTYLAIPFFQPDNWYDKSVSRTVKYRITNSYNAIYCSGEMSLVHSSEGRNTNGLVVDYVIVPGIESHGEEIELDPVDDITNWRHDIAENAYVCDYDTSEGIFLNGGCQVSEGDVVWICDNRAGGGCYLCTLKRLSNDSGWGLEPYPYDNTVNNEAPLYVRKGRYCGFYDRKYEGELDSMHWNVAFARYLDDEYTQTTQLAPILEIRDVENEPYSWEIELYQGPADYSSYVGVVEVASDDVVIKYLDIDSIPRVYSDIKFASGTVLGSCAKRLHLSSTLAIESKYRLPGYGLTVPPVLVGSFCEIRNGADTETLIPSFPIASFDSSLGYAYPKDKALSADALNRFGPVYDSDGNITAYPTARFYKYSSNATDLLSNETVRVCKSGSNSSTDPRTFLKPGAIIDGIQLKPDDRVLWNTNYANGNYNGLWVINQNGVDPTRPADGDDWADYIGKVILVLEGSLAGQVMESTATAGSFELGQSALFFRKQMPIKLFASESFSWETLDELLFGIKLIDYISVFSGDVRKLSLPVLSGTTKIGAPLGVFPLDSMGRLLDVEIDQPGTPTPPYSWIYIGTVRDLADPIHISHDVYAAGTVAVASYSVTKGAYMGSYWDFTADKEWVESSRAYVARLLFNDTTHTYISPNISIGKNMYMKFTGNPLIQLVDDDSEVNYLKIEEYDSVFNCVTHPSIFCNPWGPIGARSDYLPSETDESVVPNTPYKYDVLSFYRISDMNGFDMYPKLGVNVFPAPELISGSTDEYAIDVDFEAPLTGGIYSPDVESWEEARWILTYPDTFSDPQDTGWFSNGDLSCIFLGLEPGDVYTVTFYAKDSYGRISSKEVEVSATEPEDADVYPGTLKATSDCTTQSVLVEYIPEDEDYSDWPDPIPGGSYDVYRREYANFGIEGCPYPGRDVEETDLWYGSWSPVALNVTGTSIRDFNVKQGHSYQYAIFPKGAGRFTVDEASNINFHYYMYENPGTAEEFQYDSEDVADSNLFGASFVYRFGYNESGVPYIFNVNRNSDGSITNPAQGDTYLYDGTFIFNGETYDSWLRVDEDFGGAVVHILTNRVIAPIGPATYQRLFANDGNPVYTQWSDWSIVELDEIDPDTLFVDPGRHPSIRKAYKADIDNVWLFKYDVEDGSQTINISKGEFNTMGEFPRFFDGTLNAESGEISCWLGSEIAKGSRIGYVERRRRAIFSPLSTNEAVAMLEEWRKVVKSDRPKLLRDRKGRSWIVQITGGSSSTQGTYPGRPTKISFSWKQIGDPTRATIIYGDGDELDKTGQSGVWKPNWRPHIIRRSS